MAANTSIVLTNIDFDTHKNTLKYYLKQQDRFKDYDFDGSNMSVLLDILSYNTYHNAFYLNMIGSEMFLDTAVIRDSVVSHAKELNYTPGSFKSAQANVDINILTTNRLKRSFTIAKGTTFNSRFGNKNYTFSIGENIVIRDYQSASATQNRFLGTDITLYEGYYVTDQFTVNSAENKRYVMSNRNVDISSISVTVIEDMGSSNYTYTRATSLFGLTSTSRVFFVQGAENESYEIVFGDGVIGRKPKEGSTISIEYRISNGELPNGCSSFTSDGTIEGESGIVVLTNEKAAGGSVSESVESIKFNAPRHFTTQERAVTTEDYENLLKLNFPEINTVAAYGGEDLNPPQFGKVFVSIDLKAIDALPTVKKNEYYAFLKPRSPVSIDPVFVDPDYLYIAVQTNVKYNLNVTRLTEDDIKTLVVSAVLDYASTNLNNFNKIMRYSKLTFAIDTSQQSIVSNETKIKAIKKVIPTVGTSSTFDVAFDMALDSTSTQSIGYSITSSAFTAAGKRATVQDDGLGNLQILTATDSISRKIADIGKVNYTTGLLQITNFDITAFEGNGIKFYATPKSNDISSNKNVILNILEEDLSINITGVRE